MGEHPNPAARALVVEDDVELGALLERALREEGYAVDLVDTASEALATLVDHEFDVAVLDLRLPDGDGLGVLRAARTCHVDTPVVVLTALDSPQGRIRVLDALADDYLAKPFDLGELLARLRAVRRRGPHRELRTWRVGDVMVDEAARRVVRAGRTVTLSNRQFELLRVLLLNRSVVMSRVELARRAWGDEVMLDSNLVDVHISGLRAAVDRPFGTSNIETVRGIGYRWNPGPVASS